MSHPVKTPTKSVKPTSRTKTAASPIQRAVSKPTLAKTAAAQKAASSHILSAPKGPRTLTHRAIEKAVETVIRDRDRAHG